MVARLWMVSLSFLDILEYTVSGLLVALCAGSREAGRAPSQVMSPAPRHLFMFHDEQIFVNTEESTNSYGLHCSFSPAIPCRIPDS